MTRKQALILLLVAGLLALSPAGAVAKKHILFTDYLNGMYGVQHASGPGDYDFDLGGTLDLVVTNSDKVTRILGIKGLKNGEHLLLRHIKDDRFELQHQLTGQKAPMKLKLAPAKN
jgi:hypothetical protein